MLEQTIWYRVILVFLALTTLFPVCMSYLQRKRQEKALQMQLEQREQYLRTLNVGDEVLLLSGFHGKIVSIDQQKVRLEIAPKTVVLVERDSIMGRVKDSH